MGVYIHGMEMPTSCNECRFFVDAWCYALEVDDWRNAYNKPPEGKRLTGCPLVPVPPHGRLIDADKCIEIIERLRDHAGNEDMAFALNWAARSAAEMPTIIPAEEGE
jgi:hypothetical protein